MIRHVVHIIDAATGTMFEAPTGCDGYPHTCEPLFIPGRGVVLVTVWRETPPPIPTPPPKAKKGKA